MVGQRAESSARPSKSQLRHVTSHLYACVTVARPSMFGRLDPSWWHDVRIYRIQCWLGPVLILHPAPCTRSPPYSLLATIGNSRARMSLTRAAAAPNPGQAFRTLPDQMLKRQKFDQFLIDSSPESSPTRPNQPALPAGHVQARGGALDRFGC